jgi:hypothetical protein
MDKYIVSVNYDIDKFHEHIREQVRQLEARGATPDDMVPHLFQAYVLVPDEKFKDYIENKESEHDEERVVYKADQLMKLAETKFRQRKTNNTWIAPTADQEKVIALEATVDRLLKQQKKANILSGNPPKKDNAKSKGKNDKGKARKPMPEWKLKPPAQGEPKTKKVDGKTYHWCTNHKMWMLHMPAECKGVAPKKNFDNKKPPPKDDGKEKKLKLNVSALMAEDDE